VLERDRDRGAELRAERVRWKGRSRNMSRASQSMDERLRKMNDHASTLDKRLSRHAEEGMRWHTTWDDTSRPVLHRTCHPILYGSASRRGGTLLAA
jgi:hypothetical protein